MKLALYTTIYPGVEPYLPDWYGSMLQQTDQSFDLWIGVDAVDTAAIKQTANNRFRINWVVGSAGATPADIRQRALQEIVERYEGVVLVDSDDILAPTRVEAARARLSSSDLTACALRVIDQTGQDLRLTFAVPSSGGANETLPRNNIFGFSNSAFATNLLRRCLPIPSASTLADWYLATRAWLLGARLDFDEAPRMAYRQHANNTARICGSVTVEQIVSDTELVQQHFRLVLAEPPTDVISARWEQLRQVSLETEDFYQQVVCEPARLKLYVDAVNTLPPQSMWWTSVANPALSNMWVEQRVSA